MPVIHRLTRLLSADFNAVLDRLEDPVALLRYAIREMEQELARGQRDLQRLRLEHERVAGRERRCREEIATLDAELDLCLAQGHEELARNLVRRKLQSDQLLKRLGERRESLAEANSSLTERLAANRARYESMREKAELLAADEPAPAESTDTDDFRDCPAIDDAANEIALLAEKSRRTQQ